MKYQRVHGQLWTDEKFQQLSDHGKLLFLYVLTCKHSNLIGLYVIPRGYMEADLRWGSEAASKRLAELLQKGFILYDQETSLIFVRNYLKYNPLNNANQVKAALAIVDDLPINPSFIPIVCEQINKHHAKPLVERLTKRLRSRFEAASDSVTVTVAVTETESVTGTKRGDARGDFPGSLPGSPPPKQKPDCPISKIIEAYHRILPEFATVKLIDNGTRKNVKNRWDESPDRQTLEFWEGYFRRIGESDFLSGRKTDFKANFTWIMGPKNFSKIVNGLYDNNHKNSTGPKTQARAHAAAGALSLVDEGRL